VGSRCEYVWKGLEASHETGNLKHIFNDSLKMAKMLLLIKSIHHTYQVSDVISSHLSHDARPLKPDGVVG